MKQVMYIMGVLLGSLALVGCATQRDASGTTVRGAEGAPAIERLAREIANVLPSSDAAAAIVVVDEHGPVYAFAGNTEVHRGTGFEFASVTKVMTATLIAMLANEGRIDLDTAVTEYMEDDELNDGWDSVTARELLTHTAGVPAFPPNLNPVLLWLRGRASDPFAGYTSDRLLAGIRRSRPRAQRRWQYSNYGYAVLGYLAERQTGVSYARLLHERVLAPAGMTHSAVDRWAVSDVAPPLSRSGAPSNPFRFDAMAPAGAVRGTIEDAAAFLSAALGACSSDGELASALCASFETQRGEAQWPYDMGLGWIRSSRGDDTAVWHNGGTAGAATFLGFAEDTSIGLAILSNTAGLRQIDQLGLEFLGGEP
jgi:CubicO group peptidase (beta-lactamase class C family)